MEGTCCSETLTDSQRITWRYKPEDTGPLGWSNECCIKPLKYLRFRLHRSANIVSIGKWRRTKRSGHMAKMADKECMLDFWNARKSDIKTAVWVGGEFGVNDIQWRTSVFYVFLPIVNAKRRSGPTVPSAIQHFSWQMNHILPVKCFLHWRMRVTSTSLPRSSYTALCNDSHAASNDSSHLAAFNSIG